MSGFASGICFIILDKVQEFLTFSRISDFDESFAMGICVEFLRFFSGAGKTDKFVYKMVSHNCEEEIRTTLR